MLKIEQNQSLQSLNTLALPANAEYFCHVHSIEELQEAIAYAREHKLAITVLGGGSNMVLAKNIAGLVIHIAIAGVSLSEGKADERLVDVGAGENWHQLVEHSLGQGWFGLENLALIPGLAGAAPIQNIGAYGVELKNVFASLQAVNLHSGEVLNMSESDCEFGYRDSIFKQQYKDQFAIVGLQLRLSGVANLQLGYPALKSAVENLDEITPQSVADTVCRIRRSKLPDPAVLPNAGSFFKNPLVSAEKVAQLRQKFPNLVSYSQVDGTEKLAAGWLIDQCGWKGHRQGNVGVHEQQALVLVNYGGTGSELLALAGDVADSIENRYGVRLEIEPRVYS